MPQPLRFLKDLWNDADTEGMDEPELLRYRSNLLGSDKRLTNFGGGNTSAKIETEDPLMGEIVTVLWVKGSGGDLGTIKRDGFATLYLDKLNALKRRYKGVHEEDLIPDLYPACTFDMNPRAASIDTPLHGFLPARHVDHLHPDWAIALAACANGPEQLEKLHAKTGIKLVWLPWKRPGFALGLWLQEAAKDNPDADGIILGSHGIFTWGDDCKGCYQNTLRVLDAIGGYVVEAMEAVGEKAFGGQIVKNREDRNVLAKAVMPSLRGQAGGETGQIGHFENGEDVMKFVNSAWAKELAYQGTSCPDHFVRTKVRPLFVEWDAVSGTADDLISAAKTAMQAYREDYTRYYESNKKPDSPALRSPNPTVILVPGVGMFSFGRNKAEARITGEFYTNAIHVMEGANALSDPAFGDSLSQLEPFIERYTPDAQRPIALHNYVALPLAESFGIEYWSLEEAKLKRMPPEKELSRKVAVVLGAGPGIGLAVAERLAREGAHIALADLNLEIAQASAETLQKSFGAETAVSFQADATDRDSLKNLFAEVSTEFGGIDILVMVAAVFIPPDPVTGRNTDAHFKKTLEVNVFAAMLAADEAQKVMAVQDTEGSIVLISSANAVVAKKGSWAYDISKSAVNHLVREMAVEFAPKIRVNAVAPASVVEGSQMFPRERVIASLSKYALDFMEDESTESLREKLSQFYAKRTLLHKSVLPKDIAEAAYLLASPRLRLTTGQVIPVDAGLPEAFLR